VPDVNSIPFKQADPNGHYRSKQLPNDQHDFLGMLGLPAYAGDVVGPGGATAGQVAVFADATGKKLNAATNTGLAKLSVGVLSSVAAPSGAIVGDTDVQTLTNKTLLNPVITGLTGLTKADVGLGNVDNTSDATKNSAAVTLTNKTIVSPTISNPSGLVKSDVGLGNVDNTSDAAKPISTATQTALNLKEDKANKGVALGYPTLDASGKVPASQLPSSGASVYQGTWNAATNTPTIPAAAAGNNGWYYNVSVAGTTNINGIASWAVGDQIISNGTVWQKIPNAQAVNSVNGYTGVVVLTKSDVGLSNVDNTSDANKPVSSATTTQLNLKEDKSAKGAVSGYAGLDGSGKVPTAQLPAAALLAGTVVGPGTTVVGELATYADTTGNLLARLAPPAGVLVGTTASQTLTNKILTSPTINSPAITTPTGITKTDVGLGNVDNTSDATKNAAVATLTNKTINGANNTLTVRLDTSDTINNLPVTKLNGGTGANSGSFWRGDGQWAPPAGGGDLVGPSLSVDGELPLYSGTTGKVLKRCNLSGFVKAVPSGAATSQTLIAGADIAAGAIDNTHPNVTMITAQTEKVVYTDDDDQFLIVDKVSGALRMVRRKRVSSFPTMWLSGFEIVNNASDLVNDIDIAAGSCRDETDVIDIRVTAAVTTKRLDAVWAAGSGNGGLDTGTVAANTTYHIYVVMKADLTTDFVFTATYGSPTMPSGFVYKRRVASIVRGATTIRRMFQVGDWYMMWTPVGDHAGASNSANQSFNMALSPAVPTGLKHMISMLMTFSNNTNACNATMYDPDANSTGGVLSASVANIGFTNHHMIMTNASSQLIIVSGSQPGTYTYTGSVLGYLDNRLRQK
jgi:hypothetical protein